MPIWPGATLTIDAPRRGPRRAPPRAGRGPRSHPGLGDLAARRLRACRRAAFSDDPLRVLRLLRLAHQLGFAIEAETETLARSAAPALASVSAERVRDELTNILRLPRSAPAIRQADAWSILRVVLPEIEAMREAAQSPPHRFTVWEHSLRALEAGDALLADLRLVAPHDARVAAALAEPMGGGLTRREVWKLAVLLHDVAKPETRSVDADGRTAIHRPRPDRRRSRGCHRHAAPLAGARDGRAGAARSPPLSADAPGMLDEITRRRARYQLPPGRGRGCPRPSSASRSRRRGGHGRPRPAGVYRGATRVLLESLLAGEEPATREAADAALAPRRRRHGRAAARPRAPRR